MSKPVVGKIENVTPVVAPVIPAPATFDKNTVLILVYLLYKTNMFGNNHIKQMLEVIDKPFPENIAEYLVKEAGKLR